MVGGCAGAGARLSGGGMWTPDVWGRGAGVVVAVVQPLLLVGSAALAAQDGASATPVLPGAVRIGLFVVMGVTWLASIALNAHPLVLFLAGVCGMAALATVFIGADVGALHERGLRTSCAVVAVDVRIENSAYVAQGPPIGPVVPNPIPDYQPDYTDHSTPKTYYDYTLHCADGPITGASWSDRPAEPGDRIEIVYDPRQRVDPEPAADYIDSDGSGYRIAAVVATILMILLRVGGAIWTRWEGFAPVRRRRRW
jgi:hypothetical protein